MHPDILHANIFKILDRFYCSQFISYSHVIIQSYWTDTGECWHELAVQMHELGSAFYSKRII